jgi:hypothetical protein
MTGTPVPSIYRYKIIPAVLKNGSQEYSKSCFTVTVRSTQNSKPGLALDWNVISSGSRNCLNYCAVRRNLAIV